MDLDHTLVCFAGINGSPLSLRGQSEGRIAVERRALDNNTSLSSQNAADFNLREMFKKLRDQLLAKIDKEKLKAKIEEVFGKESEMADSLLDLINKKGDKFKQKLLELVDRVLGANDE
ncbi:hypothetical protein RhiJN_20808 [Ceratobasidium sp. AG-Ba]|nr:hypothetical protein RhiJN_20808 [Ceratobasidium sp. AG-Ba]